MWRAVVDESSSAEHIRASRILLQASIAAARASYRQTLRSNVAGWKQRPLRERGRQRKNELPANAGCLLACCSRRHGLLASPGALVGDGRGCAVALRRVQTEYNSNRKYILAQITTRDNKRSVNILRITNRILWVTNKKNTSINSAWHVCCKCNNFSLGILCW